MGALFVLATSNKKKEEDIFPCGRAQNIAVNGGDFPHFTQLNCIDRVTSFQCSAQDSKDLL